MGFSAWCDRRLRLRDLLIRWTGSMTNLKNEKKQRRDNPPHLQGLVRYEEPPNLSSQAVLPTAGWGVTRIVGTRFPKTVILSVLVKDLGLKATQPGSRDPCDTRKRVHVVHSG